MGIDIRNSSHSPLELLEEAEEIMNALLVKYKPFLGQNEDIQKIRSLVDGAIFKLKDIKPKIENAAEREFKASKGTSNDDGPMTFSDVARGLFNYLTEDSDDETDDD